MTGIDTNILVRYLVQDNPEQTQKAVAFMDRQLNNNNPGYISSVTMAETVWVLTRSYAFPDREVADAVERLLQAEVLVVENGDEVFTAAAALRTGRGKFTDALIGALAASAGCESVVTFDRKAVRLPGFKLL